MITANLLSTGAVVYLRADRTWSPTHDEAISEPDAKAIEPLVDWAKTQALVVLDPYAIEVEIDDRGVHHLSARERIRAEGPGAVLERFGYG
jgi:hypothetical protein